MTQAISTLTWQEQSDSSQPLANYTLAFGTDLVWSFQLPSTYHSAPINPRGVTVDNSQGAGTINLVSAGFTVNILPYSREDIDLSNVSQLITFNFQQTPGQPTINPYSLPIVFWMKRPSGALQNQLAINTAVQSAIVGNVLGNMQPIINSGFTEFPEGSGLTSLVAPRYVCEGWMAQSATASAMRFSRVPPLNVFGTPFQLQAFAQGSLSSAQVQWGTALTSQDSAQFQGQQITFGFDLEKFSLQPGSTLVVSLLSGTGTDQNIFTPFTGQTTLAVQSYNASTFSGRVSFSTAGTIPNTIKQIGILFQYNPGLQMSNDEIRIGRPQLDVGAIAQQFRTVPQLIERDRCQSFFEVLNSEGITTAGYCGGYTQNATGFAALLNYKRKRAIPTITLATGAFGINVGYGVAVVNSIGAAQINQDRAFIGFVTGGTFSAAAQSGVLQDNSGGTSSIFVNARM